MTTTSASQTAPTSPPTRTTKPLTFICSNCGSDEIVSDAWAEWSVATQQWALGEVFDHTFCLACETECTAQANDTEATAAEPTVAAP